MSRRRIARYVWGCMSNTEPPEDDDYEEDDDGDLTRSECVTGCEPQDSDDEPDATERERWADAACDRWERDMDARAGS